MEGSDYIKKIKKGRLKIKRERGVRKQSCEKEDKMARKNVLDLEKMNQRRMLVSKRVHKKGETMRD